MSSVRSVHLGGSVTKFLFRHVVDVTIGERLSVKAIQAFEDSCDFGIWNLWQSMPMPMPMMMTTPANT
jgi:hypothetical protein